MAPAALPPEAVGSTRPPPAVSFGVQGADTANIPADEEKKQSRFYFTRLTWGNAVQASTVGVGQSFISPTPTYDMSFTLNLRYYVVNEPLDKVYLNANLGVNVEVTDSPDTSTTTQHQPLFNDMVIGAGYGHAMYRSVDRQWNTTLGVALSATLPTSIASQAQGRYLTPGLTAIAAQALPLAGNKSNWFPDVLAFVTAGYSHSFNRCVISCGYGGLTPPSQYDRAVVGPVSPTSYADANSGAEILLPETSRDDQLSGQVLPTDRARFNFTYYLTIYKDLSFGNTWELVAPFKRQLSATGVPTSTGMAPLGGSVVTVNPTTTFDVSLSYLFFNTARVDLGYQNITPELNDNKGARNSVFYTPGGAEFYGNVSLYIDSLIDKASSNTKQGRRGLALGRSRTSEN